MKSNSHLIQEELDFESLETKIRNNQSLWHNTLQNSLSGLLNGSTPIKSESKNVNLKKSSELKNPNIDQFRNVGNHISGLPSLSDVTMMKENLYSLIQNNATQRENEIDSLFPLSLSLKSCQEDVSLDSLFLLTEERKRMYECELLLEFQQEFKNW
jgi:hypothetical protein